MSQRLLQLDDICRMNSADNIAKTFSRLGYQSQNGAQPLDIRDLELPARSAEGIQEAHLIADERQGSEALQILLFQLSQDEWGTPGAIGQRMRSIAQSLYRRPSEFLLIGTKNYDHLMLVNPRKSFDFQMSVKVGIRKLLIDRKLPTNYDRDRLEAIAAKGLSPQAIYRNQCDAFDVEKLTKEFYKGYKELFDQVRQCIANHNSHPYFDDASRLHQFSQRFLGRIMFLYFLQKKEFLAGDRDFLKTQFKPFNRDLENTNYYQSILEPLFFEMLNKDRPDFASPWGKIPYLNGGLFERDYGADIIDSAGLQTPSQLDLPNSLFDPSGEKGILKFFGSYNFTVSDRRAHV